MNREKFEAMPDVSEQLQFVDGFDGFKYHSINNHRSADWLNGAYYAFCEQEKHYEQMREYTRAQGESIKILNDERIKQDKRIDVLVKHLNRANGLILDDLEARLK